MSRIGRMPIAIPAGVTVEVAENNKVTVKGPKGTLERVLPSEMEIKVEGIQGIRSASCPAWQLCNLHRLPQASSHSLQ